MTEGATPSIDTPSMPSRRGLLTREIEFLQAKMPASWLRSLLVCLPVHETGNDMDRCEVHVEHPLVPDRRVVITLLRLVQVTNGEVVGDVEQVPFVLGEHLLL